MFNNVITILRCYFLKIHLINIYSHRVCMYKYFHIKYSSKLLTLTTSIIDLGLVYSLEVCRKSVYLSLLTVD